MPLGPYRDFDQCTTKQRRRGLAKENAARYCGAIKRDVEGAVNSVRTSRSNSLIVEAETSHLTLGESAKSEDRLPWYSVHYEYLSEDLLKIGFRVFAEERVNGQRFPVGWWMSVPPGSTYEKTSAQGIAASYQDTIGPITVKVADDQGFGFDDDDDDDGPTPLPLRDSPGRMFKAPKQLVAALNPSQALKTLKGLPRVREDDGDNIQVKSVGFKKVHDPLLFLRIDEALYRIEQGDSETRRFDVSDVYPAQSTVSVNTLKDKLRSRGEDSSDLPIVVKSNGKYHILDGHHRLVAMVLKGVTSFDATYVDLDAQYDDDEDYDDEDYDEDYDLDEEINYAQFKKLQSEGYYDKDASAALNPDNWSYDFPTLLDALEFKDRLASSGPMGRQVADKLVFRKKRLRYMAYGLPHHEKAYLERFVGQDRGPWQKREPYDEVM